jgi:AraC-like DNA-binding protein
MPDRRRGDFQEPTEGVGLLAGEGRIALCGRIDEIRAHRHAAPAVVVGVDGPLGFVAGRTHRSAAALIAPGFVHAVATFGGRIAVFLLPPYAMTKDRLPPISDLSHPRRWVELGDAVLRGELDDFAAVDRCLARERRGARPVDDRLRAALDAIGEALDENLPVEHLAARARISPSRLMALSREQLGASLRTVRRWLRTFRVARDYAAGATLTDAALAAGFSSSAHLSMAAREHFGIRPSDILSPENRGAMRAASGEPS